MTMRQRNGPAGFSRIEIVASVAILALIAFLGLPRLARANGDTGVEACVDRLVAISDAFNRFRRARGYWPPDTVVGRMPPEMRSYFADGDPFVGLTPIGGQFDYEPGLDGTRAVCIVIRGVGVVDPPALEDAMALDARIDDGDLRSGNFRAVEGGYAYAFNRR